MTAPTLSVVVPLFNEGANVDALISALTAALEPIGLGYEIVLVDDGSRDDTWARIEGCADERVRGMRFSRNFGHQPAVFAGMLAARGDAVVSIDGDLQHPPETIPAMVKAWQDGAKVVLTERIDAEDTGFFKRFTSKTFYRLFSLASGVDIAAGSSDFRLLDRQVIEALKTVGDVDLFLRGLVAWVGYPTKSIKYQAKPRHRGESKYSLRRMLRLATAGITSFSTTPLELSIWLAAITGLISLGELSFVVVAFFAGESVPGWASILGVMTLLFAVVFLILGIMGLYLTRIHRALQNRPRFIVQETHGTFSALAADHVGDVEQVQVEEASLEGGGDEALKPSP